MNGNTAITAPLVVGKIDVILSTAENAHIISNLWPLYMHDLSEFNSELPNKHGVYNDDKEARANGQVVMLDVWWKKPGILFPFILQSNDLPVGFCLVASPPHVPKDVDYLVNEFFIARPYRHKGLGEAAAGDLFNRLHGRWGFMVLPGNNPALSFWRRVISAITSKQFTEDFTDTVFGRGSEFRFTIQKLA